MKPFAANTLLQKMNRKLLQLGTLRHVFSIAETIEAEAMLEAELIEIRETGAKIQGLIKLQVNEEIIVNGITLDDILIRMKVSPNSKHFSLTSSYINDITFIGIDEKNASKIRQKVAMWRQE